MPLNMLSRIYIISSLVLLFHFTLDGAQEERPPISFQVFLWPGTPNPNLAAKIQEQQAKGEGDTMVEYIAPTIKFSPDGMQKVENIDAAERRLSPQYRYSGPMPLTFFREEPLMDGTSRRIPLAAVNTPETQKQSLLLFLPNPKETSSYRIYPIDNSLDRTRPGEACIHNISSMTIACLFDQQQVLLKPGQNKVVPLEAKEHVYIVVKIGAKDDDGDWKQRYAEQIAVNPEDSLTILIYNKPGKSTAFRIMKIDNPKNSAAIKVELVD
jgi:hypothetical protein